MNKFNKCIHQIWLQGTDEVPSQFHDNINKNKNLLKDWDYKLWDDDSITSFLKEKNIDMYHKYNNYKYLHQKVDFARYCILYYLGGFYVDMDAFILKDPTAIINKFPDYEVYISTVNLYYHESLLSQGLLELYNNGIILAFPKSDFMLRLMNECPQESNITFNKSIEINYTTGPNIFTHLAKKSKNVKILSWNYFEPCIKSNCKINDDTYVVHTHTSSWVHPYINKLMDYYIETRLLIKIILYLVIFYIIYYIIKNNPNILFNN